MLSFSIDAFFVGISRRDGVVKCKNKENDREVSDFIYFINVLSKRICVTSRATEIIHNARAREPTFWSEAAKF